jgi:hypothetical protein
MVSEPAWQPRVVVWFSSDAVLVDEQNLLPDLLLNNCNEKREW